MITTNRRREREPDISFLCGRWSSFPFPYPSMPCGLPPFLLSILPLRRLFHFSEANSTYTPLFS